MPAQCSACSVVSHCAHPTVPVDIWARCNSVSWDNSTLGLVVWIGIDSCSFGQIFGLIPKLQNSLTFVWKPMHSGTLPN